MKTTMAIRRRLPSMTMPTTSHVPRLTSRSTPYLSPHLQRYWLPVATNRSHVTPLVRPITPRHRPLASVTVGATCRLSVEVTMVMRDHRGCPLAEAPCYRATDCHHYSTELPAYWPSSTTISRTGLRVLRQPTTSMTGRLFSTLRVPRRRRRRRSVVNRHPVQLQQLYSVLPT